MTIDRDRLRALSQTSSFYKGKFRNLTRTPSHGLTDLLRWQLDSSAGFPPGKRFPLQHPDAHRLAAPPDAAQLTWIGHASFLFQYGGCNVLTDPVFAERASPLRFAGPKRHTPAALQVADLPDIHLVLISHNHYDHLCEPTIKALYRRFGDALCFAVPAGVGTWFRKRGIANVVELGWWQSQEVPGIGEVFCLPAQHFSGRGATDRNTTLWCGWLLGQPGHSLYFAGDTGYGDCFTTIGEIFTAIDLALLPIGAYDPRWFMSPVHVAPEEAVRIHQDIGARQSVAMHWGTFVLTDEPMDEPPRRLHQALAEAQLHESAFVVMQHGETRVF
ncbi:MAG: MBL fold metallo-hydrolase [Alcanivoracaceae bacterium]|nr:MBL fold metallo-hydrolase [Alcanivoracaceae bacterium]